MRKDLEKFTLQEIENRIISIRNTQIMIDRDIAEMYGVETKVLNQAVKRNLDRFPEKFRFQLNIKEKDELVTICDRFEKLKHSSFLPYAFTEQGVAMLSAVLKSPTAIKISIRIMEAFVEINKFISTNAGIFQRLDNVEKRILESDIRVNQLFKALENKSIKPKQGIFYDGQIFDAYVFIADLVKSADKSILLIDNYIDETVLQLFTKRKKNVKLSVYAKSLNRNLKLDIDKHNQQFPKVEFQKFDKAHDRFLIIDEIDVYHVGASLKDLGKKWFAFSKMDINALDMISKLNNKHCVPKNI